MVETHGRAETAGAARRPGGPAAPAHRIPGTARSRSSTSTRLLARKPAMALVDELAHTQRPRQPPRTPLAGRDGTARRRHRRLHHGQHPAPGKPQRRGPPDHRRAVSETVPTRSSTGLRDIVLVDLPPRELIERLQQGKVYVPEQAAQALQAFFSPSNLTALRELAMQTAADRVDSDLREAQTARGLPGVPLRRRVLVAIDGRGTVRVPGARGAPHRRAPRRALDRGHVQTGEHRDERSQLRTRPRLRAGPSPGRRNRGAARHQHRRRAAGPRRAQRRIDASSSAARASGRSRACSTAR